MQPSRDGLRAALTWWRGASAYDELARARFDGADVDRLMDPVLIALAFGYTAVAIMKLDDRWRAEVRGRTIRYRWDADHAEDRLNVFYGIALAILRESGNAHPTPTQAWGMTMATALPADSPLLWERHPHVPPWFVDLRLAAKRGDTGIRLAIAKG